MHAEASEIAKPDRSATRTCPHCEAESAAWVESEHLYRCRDCGRSSLAPSGVETSKEGGGASPAPSAHDGAHAAEAPGDGGTLSAAIAGAASTAVFYVVLASLPDSFLRALFLDRGWVPVALSLLAAWALGLLGERWRRVQAEQRVLASDPLAASGVGAITPPEAGRLRRDLAGLPAPAGDSFVVARIAKTLRHYETRPETAAVIEWLAREARADEARVDASFGLVRVFVWAVPTLGFIGTVLGIGAAVGGFSETLESAASLEAMRDSIGSVTSGLGVAFDTTLLALVLSLLIMFPASFVQRREEQLLARLEDYCTAQVVERLADREADPAASPEAIEQLARRLAALLARAPDD